ncbi:hypothetical protein MLD38_027422 [Melastoma candidum]|uniref:Uncharacterized protein n=1 Tax=Melastoma candidum TaxID=119954 RepID=A0ACB9P1J1_9MYRT|nr:hypothetical protein MLD38_027422 [Melastoma candidum]
MMRGTVPAAVNAAKCGGGGGGLFYLLRPPRGVELKPRSLPFSIPGLCGGVAAPGRSTVRLCTVSDGGVAAAEAVVEVSDPLEERKKVRDAGNTLDLRVGRILKAWRHEEAESLYVEEVDVGEPEPRIICSGLVKYVPIENLQGSSVIVLANLKPRNMRGVKSCGMLLAASDASHENVELLLPPDDSLPGDRVWFGDEDEKEDLPPVATPNQVQKKKIWESVQPHLKTDDSCNAVLFYHFMRTPAGLVTCRSLRNANIS